MDARNFSGANHDCDSGLTPTGETLTGTPSALRRSLIVLTLALAAFGILASKSISWSTCPLAERTRITIAAVSNDPLPPEDMARAVTERLDRALRDVPARGLLTTTGQGVARVEMDFPPSADPGTSLASVKAAIDGARDLFDQRVVITARIESPGNDPVLSYAITADGIPRAELRRRVDAAAEGAFGGLTNVARWRGFGGGTQVLDVAFDPASLVDAGLSVGEVIGLARQALAPPTAGLTPRGQWGEAVLASASPPADAEALAAMAIPDRRHGSTVPLAGLAKLALGEAPTMEQASFDGKPAILLSFHAPYPGNDALVKRLVEDRLAMFRAGLPENANLSLYWDRGRAEAAIRGAALAILVGFTAIALAGAYAWSRHPVTALTIALIPAGAAAISALVFTRLDRPVGLAELLGLVIGLGLALDMALANRRRPGRAALALCGTLAALGGATIVASAAIPAASARLLENSAIITALILVIAAPLSFLAAPLVAERSRAESPSYIPVLARLLKDAANRRALGIAATVLGVVALLGIAGLDRAGVPVIDERQFEIEYRLPAGLSVSGADHLAVELEQAVLEDPAVEHEGRLAGARPDGGPSEENAGSIRIRLKPDAKETASQVARRVSAELARLAPQATIGWRQSARSVSRQEGEETDGFRLFLTGPDPAVLATTADKISRKLARLAGVARASNGLFEVDPVIRVTPRAGGGGATAGSEVAEALGLKLGGIVVGDIRDAIGRLPVRLTFLPTAPGTPIDKTPIPARSGVVALGAIANLTPPQADHEITSWNGRRGLMIRAFLEENIGPEGFDRLRAVVAEIEPPAGYRVEVIDASAAERDGGIDNWVVAGAAGAALLVVALGAASAIGTAIASLPFAISGGLAALYLARAPLDVAAGIGMALVALIHLRYAMRLGNGASNGAANSEDPGDGERATALIATVLIVALACLIPASGLVPGGAPLRSLSISVIGGLITVIVSAGVAIPWLRARQPSSNQALGVSGRRLATIGDALATRGRFAAASSDAADRGRLGMRYWVAISIASVFGANLGDFSSHILGLGHVRGVPVLVELFAVVLLIEWRSRINSELFYWLAIVIVRTGATNLGDLATHDMGLDYRGVMVGLAALLALVVFVDGLVDYPRLRARAALPGLPLTGLGYWMAMLIAGTLGTVAGDYFADVLGLADAMALFTIILALMLLGRNSGLAGSKPYYWLTIVIIRTAGTNAADFIAGKAGFAMGLSLATPITGLLFLGLLLLWRRAPKSVTPEVAIAE